MIVVVGESLVDVVLGEDGRPSSEHVGGGPLNIAVGIARLEEPSLLVTQVGDQQRRRTSTATATLHGDGSATYSFDLGWTLPHQELPPCDALHVGSLGASLDPGRASVVDLVDQAYGRDTLVSFDPNLRPAFLDSPEAAWADLLTLADRCTLVKLSDDDVDLVQPGADHGDIARVLLQGERTELVVVTHGADGATGYAEGLEVRVPGLEVDTVDTVGAGDSFMAALLVALSQAGALSSYGEGAMPRDETALRRLLSAAATAAAITCSRRGADPPRRADLPEDWPG